MKKLAIMACIRTFSESKIPILLFFLDDQHDSPDKRKKTKSPRDFQIPF